MTVRHSTPATLQDAIHHLVLCGPVRIHELADRMGWSQSSLYRAANPCDDTNFPVAKLIPAMQAQNDFGPLRHIASRCGFTLYRTPQKIGRMQPDEIADLQKAQAEAVHALSQFFAGDITPDQARQSIDNAISKLARGRKAVDHGIKQEELAL